MFFNQLNEYQVRKGSIEVICGSMFSGKTEELLRRIKRAKYAKLKVKSFKPITDTRYDKKNIVSHDTHHAKAIVVKRASEILPHVKDTEVVAIDEAQFFDKEICNVCNELANNGIRVIVAGLDMDFLGKPFNAMPQLLAIAENITKVHAICGKCGGTANYSFRKIQDTNLVRLGEKTEYEPLCRGCFNNEI